MKITMQGKQQHHTDPFLVVLGVMFTFIALVVFYAAFSKGGLDIRSRAYIPAEPTNTPGGPTNTPTPIRISATATPTKKPIVTATPIPTYKLIVTPVPTYRLITTPTPAPTYRLIVTPTPTYRVIVTPTLPPLRISTPTPTRRIMF